MAVVELQDTYFFFDANLVAYYRFNSGALTTDSKGSNTLTNVNTVGETASCKFGYAADTGESNSNKLFTIATNLGINGNGDISISFWAKLRTEIGAGSQYFFSHTSTGGAD